MKKKKDFLFFNIIFIFFFVSCKQKTNEDLNYEVIKNFLSTKSAIEKPNVFNTCKLTNDTIYRNINLSFEEAIENLTKEFEKNENQNTCNKATKDFINSLILADFVYAVFSFQFFGPELGEAHDASTFENWDNLSLKERYNIGNHNITSVYCGERTDFYIQMLDTLLGMGVKSFFTNDVHTFPLIQLNNLDYIIDPFDPFVLLDTVNKKVVSYNELISLENENYLSFRTKRIFGNTRQLISKKKLFQLQEQNTDICSLIFDIYKNKASYEKHLPMCMKDFFPNFEEICFIKSEDNILAVKLYERPDGLIQTTSQIKHIYTENKCY
jgi:hypothetical protein